MLSKINEFLAVTVVCLNFFMIGIQESCLYTILPKYLISSSQNVTLNISFYQENILQSCQTQNPPYFLVSMVFLARNLVQIFSNSVLGYVVGKINNYFILLIGQVFGIIISLIYAFSNSVFTYIIGRCIDAFVNCALFITALAVISKLFKNINVRGRYFGIGNTLFFVSHSVGPVYGAEIDKRIGKSSVFFLLIPLWILTIIFTFCLYWRIGKNQTNLKIIEASNDINNEDAKNLNKENPDCDTNDFQIEVINSFTGSKITRKYSNCETVKSNKRKIMVFSDMFEMLKNPFVLACLFQLFIVNLSMSAIPATLPSWMGFRLCSTEVEQGLVWTFGFVGYMSGVGLIVLILKYAHQIRLFAPVFAQILVGILLILLPFSRDWRLIFIPIIGMYFSVGVVEQIIFPLTTFLADSQFNSDYGSMSSLISQFLTISGVVGTLSSGPIAERFGFHILCIILGTLNLFFCTLSLPHRKLLDF